MAKYYRFWILWLGVLALDQWTKTWVVSHAVELRRNPIVVIDAMEGDHAFMEFTYVTNPGAAWSLFSDYPEVLTLLAIFALISIFIFRKHLEMDRPLIQFVFGAITGGIAGNLGDRLFRDPAAVVDFIDVFLPVVNYDYPIFNIADSAIFIGAISYLIIGLVESKQKARSTVSTTL